MRSRAPGALIVAGAALVGAAAVGGNAATVDRAVTIRTAGTWTARAAAVPPASQLATRTIVQRGRWNFVVQGYSSRNTYDNLTMSELRRTLASVARGQAAGVSTNWSLDHPGVNASATVQVTDVRPGQSCLNRMAVSRNPPTLGVWAATGRVLWVTVPLMRIFEPPAKPTGQCISQSVSFLESSGTALTGVPSFTPLAPKSPFFKLPNLSAEAGYRVFNAVIPINVDDPAASGPTGKTTAAGRVVKASYHFTNDRQPAGVVPTYRFDYRWDATFTIGVH